MAGGPNRLRHPIVQGPGAVCVNGDRCRIVFPKDALDEEAHGVLAEIGGNIADAQGTLPQGGQGRSGKRAARLAFGPLAPFARLAQTLRVGNSRIVFLTDQRIAPHDRDVR